MKPEPPRAACAGQWDLFDATDPRSHQQAAAICRTCPILNACADRLRAELTVGKTIREAGGGPRGTWAGRLIGKDRHTPKPREHATERGYQQHRTNGEKACDECLIAHRLKERARVRGAA